jgi:hypothetical protein
MSGNLASMGKTARELKKLARQERNERRARRREGEAMAERFGEAYHRWNAHRGEPLHESCPLCSLPIIITPHVEPGADAGAFNVDHLVPMCEPFEMLMAGMKLLLGALHRQARLDDDSFSVDPWRNVG